MTHCPVTILKALVIGTLVFSCATKEGSQISPSLQLVTARVGATNLDLNNQSNNKDLPVDQPIVVKFSSALDASSVSENVALLSGEQEIQVSFSFLDEDKAFAIAPGESLSNNSQYVLVIKNIKGKQGESFPGFTILFSTIPATLQLISYDLGGIEAAGRIVDVPLNFTGEFNFSHSLDKESVTSAVRLFSTTSQPVSLSFSDDDKKLVISSSSPLEHFNLFTVVLSSDIKGTNGEKFERFEESFYTTLDPTPKFPEVSDDALLTLVQQQTFKYFWDFGHPDSGMARERNTSGNTVTSGGSGFGVMAILVAIERNFITRTEGIQRLNKIIGFLETADRFHGAWSHWINGSTGAVIPFSADDNGGDLVETAFMIQGLLTVRQYLNPGDPTEQNLINRINSLWQAVEWDWYTQSGQDVLYWHWSPNFGWVKNHKIQGWNEALIIYVLAASSPTHTISKSVYTAGWARNGAMQNGKQFYGFTLPLGSDRGGPLFFAHYSFLGLDPRNLSDAYANYWDQNVAHSKINHAYCVDNPQNYVGYSDATWGLTASDGNNGYSAHSPSNDRGVITPTAALSSFPYTPAESMDALKFFYYKIGDKTWGQYGFYDAFNTTAGWYGDSDIAIDQGPIIVMIENYRTGLLWDLFMSCPEVQSGLTKLGFSY